MRGAGADWQMAVYGDTVHSFTNRLADLRGMPDTLRYSPAADRRSWAAMLCLFDEALAPAVAGRGSGPVPPQCN